ncbi:MAG TPA: AI-2E family transporter [Polyangiaceae bacterium]|nr:AI-2E family transporter [Polyangiaceae bacterium]
MLSDSIADSSIPDLPPPSVPHFAPSSTQRKALGICAVAAVAALAWLSLPVASGLFLGTFLAFSLLDVYETLQRRWRRPSLAAVLLALGSGFATVIGLLFLIYFLVVRGIAALSRLAQSFGSQGSLKTTLDHLNEATQKLPFGPFDITGRVRQLAEDAALQLTSLVRVVAGATFGALLILFFTVMTTFFVLRHWTRILAQAERMLPLHPMHTRVVLAEFQKVGKEVFIGTMLTGIIQGLLAGVGYALGNVPEPGLLAALTAICSLVPALGTLLIWVPVGVALLLWGHPAAGIFELLWGALMVGVLSDYVIRPRLVGGSGHIPTLLTFIALFGGVEVFGVLGLIIGPVIAAVALALLRTYDREICNPPSKIQLS